MTHPEDIEINLIMIWRHAYPTTVHCIALHEMEGGLKTMGFNTKMIYKIGYFGGLPISRNLHVVWSSFHISPSLRLAYSARLAPVPQRRAPLRPPARRCQDPGRQPLGQGQGPVEASSLAPAHGKWLCGSISAENHLNHPEPSTNLNHIKR